VVLVAALGIPLVLIVRFEVVRRGFLFALSSLVLVVPVPEPSKKKETDQTSIRFLGTEAHSKFGDVAQDEIF
jgi:O-antigen ligase